MLDRLGGEVARASCLVRFVSGSLFPKHAYDGGEGFWCWRGCFPTRLAILDRGLTCAIRWARRIRRLHVMAAQSSSSYDNFRMATANQFKSKHRRRRLSPVWLMASMFCRCINSKWRPPPWCAGDLEPNSIATPIAAARKIMWLKAFSRMDTAHIRQEFGYAPHIEAPIRRFPTKDA
jgi:hypothetical protein